MNQSNDTDAIDRRFEQHETTLPLYVVELVVGFILMVVVGIYLRDAAALPTPMNPSDVGAGRFPMIAGSGAALALIAVLIHAVLAMRRGDDRRTTIGRPAWVLAGVGLLIAQALAFERLGALPVIVLSALLIMLACGERRPLHLIPTPLAIAAAIYVTFTVALGIQLP